MRQDTPFPVEETPMRPIGRWSPSVMIPLLLCVATPWAQEPPAAPPRDLCKGVSIPFAAAAPAALNTWVVNTDLKDLECGGVSVSEIRTRARKNPQGEMEVVVKVTTYTRPGHDKKASVTLEVMARDIVVRSTVIERIDAEERKYGRGSGYLVFAADQIVGGDPRMRVTLEALDD